jgi:hypothetical protein
MPQPKEGEKKVAAVVENPFAEDYGSNRRDRRASKADEPAKSGIASN